MREYWQLKQMQQLPLQAKVQKSRQRIVEWYNYWNGSVYISFSGGKDSTVLMNLVRGLYPDVEAMFVDTGLEYPEIRDFVKKHNNVTIVRPEKSFRKVIEEYGYPVISKEVSNCVEGARKGQSYRIEKLNGTLKDRRGNKSAYNQEKWKFLLDAPFKISDKCCDVMKKKPAHKFSKESGKKAYLGTMAQESRLRTQKWLQKGCNAFENKVPVSTPLAFWTEQDILRYLKEENIEIAKCYGEIVPDQEIEGQISMEWYVESLKTTKCSRTGCMFCMFGAHLEKEPNRFQLMKETHPKLYDYCINKLGLKEVLEYINVKF